MVQSQCCFRLSSLQAPPRAIREGHRAHRESVRTLSCLEEEPHATAEVMTTEACGQESCTPSPTPLKIGDRMLCEWEDGTVDWVCVLEIADGEACEPRVMVLVLGRDEHAEIDMDAVDYDGDDVYHVDTESVLEVNTVEKQSALRQVALAVWATEDRCRQASRPRTQHGEELGRNLAPCCVRRSGFRSHSLSPGISIEPCLADGKDKATAAAEAQRVRAEKAAKRQEAAAEAQRFRVAKAAAKEAEKQEAAAEARRAREAKAVERQEAAAEAQLVREVQATQKRKEREEEAQRKRLDAHGKKMFREGEAQRKREEAESRKAAEAQRKREEAEARKEAEARRKREEAESRREAEAQRKEEEARRKETERAEAQQRAKEQAERRRDVIVLHATSKAPNGLDAKSHKLPRHPHKIAQSVDIQSLIDAHAERPELRKDQKSFAADLAAEVASCMQCRSAQGSWKVEPIAESAIGTAKRKAHASHYEFEEICDWEDFNSMVLHGKHPIVIIVLLVEVRGAMEDDEVDGLESDDEYNEGSSQVLEMIRIPPPPRGSCPPPRNKRTDSATHPSDAYDDTLTSEYIDIQQRVYHSIVNTPPHIRTQLQRCLAHRKIKMGENLRPHEREHAKRANTSYQTFEYLSKCAMRYLARQTHGESRARELMPSLYVGPSEEQCEIVSWNSLPHPPGQPGLVVWPHGTRPESQTWIAFYESGAVCDRFDMVYGPRNGGAYSMPTGQERNRAYSSSGRGTNWMPGAQQRNHAYGSAYGAYSMPTGQERNRAYSSGGRGANWMPGAQQSGHAYGSAYGAYSMPTGQERNHGTGYGTDWMPQQSDHAYGSAYGAYSMPAGQERNHGAGYGTDWMPAAQQRNHAYGSAYGAYSMPTGQERNRAYSSGGRGTDWMPGAQQSGHAYGSAYGAYSMPTGQERNHGYGAGGGTDWMPAAQEREHADGAGGGTDWMPGAQQSDHAYGSGDGAYSMPAGQERNHGYGAGYGTEWTPAAQQREHADGAGGGTDRTPAAQQHEHADGAGGGTDWTPAAQQREHAYGSGDGAYSMPAGQERNHGYGAGYGTEWTPAAQQREHADGAGGGTDWMPAAQQSDHAYGSGDGAYSMPAGQERNHGYGAGYGTEWTPAAQQREHADGAGGGTDRTPAAQQHEHADGAGGGTDWTPAAQQREHACGSGAGFGCDSMSDDHGRIEGCFSPCAPFDDSQHEEYELSSYNSSRDSMVDVQQCDDDGISSVDCFCPPTGTDAEAEAPFSIERMAAAASNAQDRRAKRLRTVSDVQIVDATVDEEEYYHLTVQYTENRKLLTCGVFMSGELDKNAFAIAEQRVPGISFALATWLNNGGDLPDCLQPVHEIVGVARAASAVAYGSHDPFAAEGASADLPAAHHLPLRKRILAGYL